MSHRPTIANHLKVLGAQFFGTITLVEFVLKTRALPKLFPTVSPPSTLSSLPSRSFPTELSPTYFPQFPFRASISLSKLSPCYFPRFPLRPPSRPSPRSSPQAISHNFPSFHPVVPFHLARSQQSSPHAISDGFLCVLPLVASISPLPPQSSPQAISHRFRSVHPLVASLSLSLLPHALPKLSPTVSPSVHLVVASISLLPRAWSCPQAISHGFLSVHPLVASVSLLLTELSPCYFPRFPLRPPCRHFHLAPSPRSSFQAISHGFPSVHPLVASISPLLPRFPVRPPSRRFRSAPSQRSSPQAISQLPHGAIPLRPFPSQRTSPQAISHGFPSVHPLITSVSLPSRQVQLNENLSIGDAFGKKCISKRKCPSDNLNLKTT